MELVVELELSDTELVPAPKARSTVLLELGRSARPTAESPLLLPLGVALALGAADRVPTTLALLLLLLLLGLSPCSDWSVG